MAQSEKYGLSSAWSERHAAYVSGLGTFGLCDGLITPLGKAMRCGSVIARLSVTPTPRLYEDHHAYCLFFTKGICGKCADRCPAGAISKEKGHDKKRCQEYIDTKNHNILRNTSGLIFTAAASVKSPYPANHAFPFFALPYRMKIDFARMMHKIEGFYL